MTDEAKEARRAYKREWNRTHKDKVKEYQARYWERRAKQEQTDAETTAAEAE